MPAIINFKICDNAKECDGVKVCSTGALSWNKTKKGLVVDEKKCISCGKCASVCLAQAIKIADNDEFEKIKKEIEQDNRKISDLFIERYGAQPIDKNIVINQEAFNNLVLNSKKIVVGEFFDEDQTMCLIKSIPIKELFKGKNIEFYKVEVGKKYKKLPFLVFYKNGKMIGKIEGYYNNIQKKELVKKIDFILLKNQ